MMKKLIATAVTATVIANASFAVSIPSGTAITGNSPQNTNMGISLSDVCSFAENMTTNGTQLTSLSYFKDATATPIKHYLFGQQTAGANRQVLSGYLSTANYSRVRVDLNATIADSFAGGTQTSQANMSIGGATTQSMDVTDTGNNTTTPTVLTREEPLASGYTPLWINDFVVESTSGFSKYAANPEVSVTITCLN